MSVANKAALQIPLLRHVRKEWKLYSFLLIPVIYFIIFKYVPMLGNVIAFRKYRGGTNLFGTEWVG
ncbi:sugar ABC transporter permease, partial [Paenibacillus sp. TAF58]